MRFIAVCFVCLINLSAGFCQQEKRWIKLQINTLASPSMYGRGYINKGVEKAANYLNGQFQSFGLVPFNNKDSGYLQAFSMPVNTFPGSAYLKLQKKELRPGWDYIVNAASSSYATEKMRVKTVNLRKVKDSASWVKIKKRFEGGRTAWLLKHADTVIKYVDSSSRSFSQGLPAGLYLLPRHGKLTWTVAQNTIPATIYYIEDTVMPRRIKRAAARLDARFQPAFRSYNVAGYVPGTKQPDSFVVFTAHFDHLGKMGRSTTFPGAHDNASGTALMLYLANYFSQHPQPYTTVFIGFSGEEAGLVGSEYYTNHPLFPLERIKMVVNTDMTGDATNGITVVNATEQKEAFALLGKINAEKGYLPEIKERGQTHNSDHYHFSAHGVPAIFIYGNGTKGFYHDIFDKPQELSMENIDGLVKLLIEFTGRL